MKGFGILREDLHLHVSLATGLPVCYRAKRSAVRALRNLGPTYRLAVVVPLALEAPNTFVVTLPAVGS